MEIWDGGPNPVKTWSGTQATSFEVTWDGKDGTGQPVADGRYKVKITALSGGVAAEEVVRYVVRDSEIDHQPAIEFTSCDVNFKGITGTATDENMVDYLLEVGKIENEQVQEWKELSHSSARVEDGSLGVWSCRDYEAGDYRLRLTVRDAAGNSGEAILDVTATGGHDLEAPTVTMTAPTSSEVLT